MLKPRWKTYWNIFWKMRQLHLMRMFEYRGDFFFWAGVSTMWTIFNFFFFAVITGLKGTIAGWTLSEMMLLMSVFAMLDAFTWSFFYSNMTAYTRSIFTGDFQRLLLQPIDAQFMAMTQWNNYSNVPRFLLGLGIIVWYLIHHSVTLGLGTLIVFSFTFMVCLLFIYFLWFILSTTAFWMEKVDNINEIVPNLRAFWQVPQGVYQGVLSTIFTVVLPIGLMSSLPSEVLLGRASWGWIGYLTSITGLLFLFGRWFFQVSARKFSGIGN